MDAMTEHDDDARVTLTLVSERLIEAWNHPIDHRVFIDARRSLDVIEPNDRYTTDV